MLEGFSLYDTHTHIGSAAHSGMRQSAADLLAVMDHEGVDRAVAIPFPVVADQRAAHDEIALAVKQHPDRFSGAICLDPFLPEQQFRDEIRRSVEQLGLRALKLQPQYCGLNPLSARADFFFGVADEFKLPVIVHTGSGVPFSLPSLYISPANKFPALPIILGHAGGPTYSLETIVAAEVCPNILIELSSLMPHHLLEIVKRVPSSRLMAGSDLPTSVRVEMGKIVTLPIEVPARRDILWNTARRVFDAVTDA